MPFKPGQINNPHGRPKREVEKEYLHVLMGVVTIAKWKQVCEKALKQAMAGDTRARDWLSKYLMGPPPTKPTSNINIDFSKLSDKQLERIADGEDPLAVIAGEG